MHIDLSDRKRKFRAIHGDTEQTAGDDDVVIRSAFAEILKRGQCSFTELHLIKYDQRFFFYDGLISDTGEDRNQIVRADVFIEGFTQLRIRLKVKVSHILIMRTSELENRIGFSDLPRPL